SLVQHRDGTGSIELASTMKSLDPSRRGRRGPPWRAFDHLPDADKAFRVLNDAIARADARFGHTAAQVGAAESVGAGSNEALDYGRHRLLDYYEPVRAILKPGESP